MAKVDFKKVRQIPIASVLHFYKVAARRRSNTQLVAQCPFPSHPKDSKHQWTLAINTEKGKGMCHNTRCQEASNKPKGFDTIDFVCMMENLTPLDGAKRLAEIFCISDTPHPPSKPLPEPPQEGNKPLAWRHEHLNPEHSDIQRRGISVKTATEYGAGFHGGKGIMANRICFPLYENGQLIGYAGRTTLEVTADNPKWRLPNGLVKSFLYGLERCSAEFPLVIVEGCWAVLWLFEKGIQSCALLGSSLTQQQEALLTPFKVIRICLDDDEAGHTAANAIAERLKANHRVTKAFLRK